jgi:polyamine oxidase
MLWSKSGFFTHALMDNGEQRVLVIGAGVAGLTAARVLASAGRRVVVLEGADQAGGRLRSAQMPSGERIELGANWVHGIGGEEKNPIWALKEELGLEGRVDDRDGGLKIVMAQPGENGNEGGRQKWQQRRDQLAKAMEAVEEQHGDRPDVSVREALRWHSWVPSSPLDFALEWMDFDFEYGDGPEDASVRHNILEEQTRITYGDESWLCTDARGFDAIAKQLHEDAVAAGAEILLGRVVRRVEGTGCGVVVHTAGGERHTADLTIVTASLGVLQSGAIEFTPRLPVALCEALSSYRMAHYAKVFAEYPVCWWRPPSCSSGADGGSGEGMASLLGGGHTLLVNDARGRWPLLTVVSDGDGRSGTHAAILCATAVGTEARRLEELSEADLATELTEVLRSHFPEARVPPPAAIRRSTWGSDPLYRGAYSFLPVGALSRPSHTDSWSHLQEPLWDDGRLWLAGEACHPLFSGYLHGALLSGRDTARRVLLVPSDPKEHSGLCRPP